MFGRKTLGWLEWIGIRSVFFLAPQGRIESQLPTLAEVPTSDGYNSNIINDKLEQGRYFVMSNASRAVLHFPIIYFFLRFAVWWAALLYIIFCVWHALLIFMELYKMSILSLVTPNPEAKEPPGAEFRPNPWGDAWFLLKWFETERFYERLRMVQFQKFTRWYIEVARLTKAQRQAGKKIEFVSHLSYSEVARFEANTRVSELVHLIFCGFDMIPLVYVFMLRPTVETVYNPIIFWGFFAYFTWIFSGDFRLVLLQRYHRVRVWKILLKFKEREEKKNKRTASVPSEAASAR